MSGALLTINAGSSSLKASLFDIDAGAPTPIFKGEVEGVGTAPRFTVRDHAGEVVLDRSWPDADTPFDVVLETVIAWAESRRGEADLKAVGHRVVHGGRDYVHPRRVTPQLLDALDRLTPLAPLHQPHNLAPIRAIAAARPDLPQVACFDTAFHATMPTVAKRFALPRAYEDAGVWRYGFHGLSYEHIAWRLAAEAPDLAAGRVIAAHLGAGASLCAMAGGRSLDTTMGFTAVDGLVMGTRCGELDPGVVLYMQREDGLSVDQVETVLNRKSGLLGVSGISSDMRALLASDSPRAAQAIELFVYRITRDIGGLTSVLGGLDGLVFTAGIGAKSPPIRQMVCERLAWLGLILDPEANAAGTPVISAPESLVEVRVIPADEEETIARHTLANLTDG